MAYTPEQIGEQVRIAATAAQAREPGKLAAAIAILLDHDNWRAYIDPADHRKHEWQDFRLFVRQRLGTTPEALVGALNHAPGLAARVAELATAGPGEAKDEGTSSFHPETLAGGLRQLRQRGHRTYAERVEAGEMSLSAARIEVGLASPRIKIPVDSAKHAMRLLTRPTRRRPEPPFTTTELRDALDDLDRDQPMVAMASGTIGQPPLWDGSAA